MAAPSYTPVHVPKVFSHKAMVGATRQKYLQLPEVRSMLCLSLHCDDDNFVARS